MYTESVHMKMTPCSRGWGGEAGESPVPSFFTGSETILRRCSAFPPFLLEEEWENSAKEGREGRMGSLPLAFNMFPKFIL